MSKGMSGIQELSLYLIIGGGLAEVAGKFYNRPLRAIGQTGQNIAAVLPAALAISHRFFMSKDPAMVKVLAGLGLGILGIPVALLTLTPFGPLYMEAHTVPDNDPNRNVLGIANLINAHVSGFFKVVNIYSLRKLDPIVAVGIGLFSLVTFIIPSGSERPS